MAIQVNLAMTGAEISHFSPLPPNIAWMACHFSPWSRGLSNLPPALPEGSLLVLDDQLPWFGHDESRIAEELTDTVRNLGAAGVLLDFQRPGVKEVQSLADKLCQALPCPVGVVPAYGAGLSGAVFLPPLPCHMPLRDWLAPWEGQEVWLELSLDREVLTLTQTGTDVEARDFDLENGFKDEKLRCHYTVAAEEEKAVFHLWRTREDLEGLIRDGDNLGVIRAVGLYQELGSFNLF